MHRLQQLRRHHLLELLVDGQAVADKGLTLGVRQLVDLDLATDPLEDILLVLLGQLTLLKASIMICCRSLGNESQASLFTTAA